MIKIFDKNKNFIKGTEDYKDIRIEEEQNLTSTLSFSIPLSLKDLIEEEGYIEIKDEGSFVIKEININIESISVICKQNLEDLTSNVSNKAYVTKTMQYILSDLLQGTGWTGVADTNISRTVTGVNMSVLDYIYKAIDTFKYEVKFDSVNKKVIAKEKIGSDKGVYFHDEVNLKSTNVASDTYDFVTRIIPIGFDDLGIELINGGKSYVENHSYSNKIITLEWKDERYTVAENLKRDAQLKLDKLCRPLRAYSCSIEDLSKSIDYSILEYEVGDTIDLIDKEKGIGEKQRIIKTVKYLNSEGEDTVEIANRPRIFGDDLDNKIEDAINDSFSITNSKLDLLEDKIIAEVETVSQSVIDNVTTINEKMGQLIITDNEISNIVHDLTTTVGENYTELDNKIGSLDIKADGIDASVSNLTTTVDDNKTETDNKIGALEITADNISTEVSRVETVANRAEDKADTNALNVTEAYSYINQTADDINLEVGRKVGKNEVISSINLSPESAKIQADNINLVGAVTVLSDIAGNLGSITAGTINIGSDAFEVTSDGWLHAGRGGFSVPPDANGVYNAFTNTTTGEEAARWKYSDFAYIYQSKDNFRVYTRGTIAMELVRVESHAHTALKLMNYLENGALIKALGTDKENEQVQFRNVYDKYYIDIAASNFKVASSAKIKKDITYCKSKLELVKNTPVFNFRLKDDKSDTMNTGFIVESSPKEIVTDLGDEKGISIVDTLATLWKAVQELNAKVEKLEGKNNGVRC